MLVSIVMVGREAIFLCGDLNSIHPIALYLSVEKSNLELQPLFKQKNKKYNFCVEAEHSIDIKITIFKYNLSSWVFLNFTNVAEKMDWTWIVPSNADD